jgi:MOSC domain-containing protein YiiM
MGTLVSIVYKPRGAAPVEEAYTRLPLQEARLLVGKGIEGDAKGGARRQLNIMAAASVANLEREGFSATPGGLGEQLILADIEIDSLLPGTRIQIGESACIEVTELRTGCGKFERYQGRRKAEVQGRLGQMARVVVDGVIRIGDSVKILPMSPTA